MPQRPDLVECWVFRVRSGSLELLLVHRASGRIFAGLWQPVTGAIDEGERVPLAALREVAEETGFAGSDVEAFYDLDQVAAFYDEGPDALLVSAIFAVRVRPDAELRLSDEHDAARWVDASTALRLAVWPAYADSIGRIERRLLDPDTARWFAVDPGTGRRVAR
jgi:8-oxo-dGTP pyrophosphatase MutT (NUDIX family)